MAEKQITQQEAYAILAKRELERRKILRDELYFFENYVYIENKDGKNVEDRSILFHLFPEQRRVLKEINEHKLNIIIKARQLGMTWMAVAHGLRESLRIPQFTTVILSQTEDYMKDAIDRFKYIIERLPKWLIREYNKDNLQYNSVYLYESLSGEITIYHPTGEDGTRVSSTIKGLVSTEKAGRSITADLIVFDEWAYHEGAEAIFQAAFPIINRPESGQFIGISTNKRGSFFESIVRDCLDNDSSMGFNLIFLSVWCDTRRTQEWYARTKATLTNTWQSEYPETVEQALSAGELTAFPEFSREDHVCEPFEIPKHWKRWAAVDNGYIDPFVWMKAAVDEDGTTYIYYEYTRDRTKDTKMHYSDQAEHFMRDCTIDVTKQAVEEIEDLHLGFPTDGIQQFEKENIEYIILGLDAFNKNTLANGKSLLDFYVQSGMSYPPVRANTDRVLRKSVLHEYLKVEDNGAGERKAKLKIFSTCKYTIKYLPLLVVEETNPNVVADNHNIDNVYDALGYILIGSPRNNTQRIKVEDSPMVKYKKEKIKALHKGKYKKGILN